MTLAERRKLWVDAGAKVRDIKDGFCAIDVYGHKYIVTEDGAQPFFENPKAADLYRDYQTLINGAFTSDDVRFAMSVRDQAMEAERQVSYD